MYVHPTHSDRTKPSRVLSLVVCSSEGRGGYTCHEGHCQVTVVLVGNLRLPVELHSQYLRREAGGGCPVARKGLPEWHSVGHPDLYMLGRFPSVLQFGLLNV